MNAAHRCSTVCAARSPGRARARVSSQVKRAPRQRCPARTIPGALGRAAGERSHGATYLVPCYMSPGRVFDEVRRFAQVECLAVELVVLVEEELGDCYVVWYVRQRPAVAVDRRDVLGGHVAVVAFRSNMVGTSCSSNSNAVKSAREGRGCAWVGPVGRHRIECARA